MHIKLALRILSANFINSFTKYNLFACDINKIVMFEKNHNYSIQNIFNMKLYKYLRSI